MFRTNIRWTNLQKTSCAAKAYELAGTCQERKHIDEFKILKQQCRDLRQKKLIMNISKYLKHATYQSERKQGHGLYTTTHV
jgi:hypothetical protein